MTHPVPAFVALGANLGDARQALRDAIAAIGQLPETRLVRQSSQYRTAPVGAGGPDYINAVVEVATTLTAPALLAALQGLEQAAGRDRPYRNAPRTLDLDLLLYGSARISSPALTVPHPRMHERAFVLVPLAEIAPALVTPAQLQGVAGQGVRKLRHGFQQQDSRQTLAQGLQEYFAVNPGLARGSELSAAAAAFFRCHDTAHVVFGCDVALDDELVVKIASLLGTTGGLGVLAGYRLHESLRIYRQLRVADVMLSILHSLVIVPRTALRCLAQRARWPWADHQDQMHVPLGELRRAFGIRVAHNVPASVSAQETS